MTNLEAKQERYNVLVSRIVTNKGVTTSAIYQIGLDLKEIQERELYLLDCRDFKQFLETRVEIERSTAYLAIEMAKAYSVREFNKWGLGRLMLIKRQLPEEQDRKEFMKTQPVDTVESIRHNVNEYKLERGLEELDKDISSIKGQIGQPAGQKEETIYKLLRQFQIINTHYDSFKAIRDNIIQEIENWLVEAKKHKNQQIYENIIQSEQMLEELK